MDNTSKNKKVAELIDEDWAWGNCKRCGGKGWHLTTSPKIGGGNFRQAIICSKCQPQLADQESRCDTSKVVENVKFPLDFCSDPAAAWKLLEWWSDAGYGLEFSQSKLAVTVPDSTRTDYFWYQEHGQSKSIALVDAFIAAMEGGIQNDQE